MRSDPVRKRMRLIGLLLVLGAIGLYYRLVELLEGGVPHGIHAKEVMIALASLACGITGIYLLGRGRKVFPRR